MLVRLTASLIVLAAAWSVPRASLARAGSPTGIVTSVTADGLNLSLFVPKADYPQDALVRVQVTLRNVSRRAVWVLMPGRIMLGTAFPQPEVVDRHGTVIYPPVPLGNVLTTGGPVSYGRAFRPRERVTKQVYVILHARYVRAAVRVSAKRRVYPSAYTEVRTPAVTITIVPGGPPAVRLRQEGSPPVVVAADLQPPAGVHGQLHYMDATDCGDSVWVQDLTWTSKQGSRLSPGCDDPLEWHVVAGWLNEPVVTIDYLKRG